MATTKRKAWVVSGEWLEDAWEWATDALKGTDALLQVSMYPSKRKGVWSVTVRALHVVDSKPAGVWVQTRGEYPNANQETYGAFLARLCAELGVLLVEDAFDKRNSQL